MYHENYSKRHESRVLETFKYFVLADTGIDLDFRSYGYAENGHNLTPVYSYSIAASLVDSVLKFWGRCGVDIDGRYNKDSMIEKLQTTRLKAAIEEWLVSEISEALFADALQAFTNSIAQQGVMQPIVARKIATDKYEIVAGARRWLCR